MELHTSNGGLNGENDLCTEEFNEIHISQNLKFHSHQLQSVRIAGKAMTF